jgi:hypothetical protein
VRRLDDLDAHVRSLPAGNDDVARDVAEVELAVGPELHVPHRPVDKWALHRLRAQAVLSVRAGRWCGRRPRRWRRRLHGSGGRQVPEAVGSAGVSASAGHWHGQGHEKGV